MPQSESEPSLEQRESFDSFMAAVTRLKRVPTTKSTEDILMELREGRANVDLVQFNNHRE